MNLFESKDMEGMSAIDQAKKAIAHVLSQRHHNPVLAAWIGIGSGCFQLLTEAHATLRGIDLAQVRRDACAAEVVDVYAWKRALEAIEAAGRPHGGPVGGDPCECEQCEAWDGAVKALKGAGR